MSDTEERKGLSWQQVEERRRNGLVNGDVTIRTKSIKRILAEHIFTIFNGIQLFLGGCLLVVHSYKNMLFLGVVFWNLLIGIVQEIRSKRMIDRLSLLSQPKVTVYRNGKKKEILYEEIVQDDLLVLEIGNQVCVDVLALEGSCEVNESFLTGETEPVFKRAGDEILSGSFLVSGQVEAIAVHVGKESYANRITASAKYIKKSNSKLMNAITRIIRVITIILIPVMCLLFYNQLNTKHAGWQLAVIRSVGAVIGMIPSGLVLLTSVVLAVSMMRLAKKNTLVQDMYCIETLARVDTLCLDKTGTLTEGRMDVKGVELLQPELSGEKVDEMIVDFTTALKDHNPTFLAVQAYAEEVMEKMELMSREELVRHRIYFSSEKKWSLVDFEEKGCYCIGAPEFLMPEQEALKKQSRLYAKQGIRVLLLAHSLQHSDGKELPRELQACAFLLLEDRIRPHVAETLAYFKKQGVDVKIISGDHPETILAIARRAGMDAKLAYADATTWTSQKELEEAAKHCQIFGRVTPMQKRELIRVLKESGHVVAMTGDGVNDVMALREADCGIAMQSGSAAARNVSNIILTKSDFSAMPHIVEEGRRTIHNIGRSASLYLTKTIYATMLAVLFILLKKAYPFQPVQQTLIGMLTIGIPSFFLALEPNFERVGKDFFRSVLRYAIPGAICVIAGVCVIQYGGSLLHASWQEISTMSFLVLAAASFLELYFVSRPLCRWRGWMYLLLLAVFAGCLFIAGSFFELCLLPVGQCLLVAVVIAGMPFLFMGSRRLMREKKKEE